MGQDCTSQVTNSYAVTPIRLTCNAQWTAVPGAAMYELLRDGSNIAYTGPLPLDPGKRERRHLLRNDLPGSCLQRRWLFGLVHAPHDPGTGDPG